MAERTPPFSALRALEAASRHKSFTWAARELNITHSAVSQSIRRLEADLGAVLFERNGRAMEPSDAALRLAQSYQEAAKSLGETLRAITGDPAATTLSMSMPADFGRLWFAGKLSRLTDALPDIRVEIGGGKGGERDIELLLTAALAPGDLALAPIEAFPVCSPAFAKTAQLKDPKVVLKAPLLCERPLSWTAWADRFAPAAPPPRAHAFDDAGMSLAAAASGQGVALTHLFSAESMLDNGQLVALPFVSSTDLKLVMRPGEDGAKSEAIGRFAMWLKLEVGRSAAQLRRSKLHR